jgi:hypothetical protein
VSATEPNTSLAWAHEVGARKLTGEDAIHWWTVRAQKAEAELDALHEQLDRDGIARAPLAVRVRCLVQESKQRLADLSGESTFIAQRVAWHLAHGCDTAQRARELALAEWDAGVLGEVRP